MLNFTVGPVMSSQEIIDVAHQSTPYFRTPEFSKIMLENEEMMLHFLHAPKNSRCAFLTASGTGGMESCVINLLSQKDKVLVIDGGTFGHRFVQLLALHQIPHDVLSCPFGHSISKDHLIPYENKGYTALVVNMDETSSGILYNMPLLSRFCKKEHMLFLVDAVSAFLSDTIEMEAWDVDAVIVGSQKALAVQPGIVAIALSPRALLRVENHEEKVLYLSLKEALKNGERGQTPFTPAVITLMQIHKRCQQIEEAGGIEEERKRIHHLAHYFRKQILPLPFSFLIPDDKDRSNALTTLRPLSCNATTIVQILKDDYHIWVCPNGGIYADKIFRVGHIGNITTKDVDLLIEALWDMRKKKMI